MYLAPDDAKTDVILTAAVAVFGVSLRGFVASLALYPGGTLGAALDVVWILALSALVPVLLARHRGDGAAAFGLDRSGWWRGGVLALPGVGAGVLVALVLGAPARQLLLGRLAGVGLSPAPIRDTVLTASRIAAFTLGALLLISFLATRSRVGFPRSPDVALKALIRSIGLGAVGVVAVAGALRSIGLRGEWLTGLAVTAVYAAALFCLVLLADRRVPFGLTVPRTTVIAPLIVVAVAHLSASGGLFRGDLLTGLYTAALASGATLVVSALAQTRWGTAPAVWLLLAVHWWPTCLSPLSLATGAC